MIESTKVSDKVPLVLYCVVLKEGNLVSSAAMGSWHTPHPPVPAVPPSQTNDCKGFLRFKPSQRRPKSSSSRPKDGGGVLLACPECEKCCWRRTVCQDSCGREAWSAFVWLRRDKGRESAGALSRLKLAFLRVKRTGSPRACLWAGATSAPASEPGPPRTEEQKKDEPGGPEGGEAAAGW